MATSTFSEWTQGRQVLSVGTNNGAIALSFQEWCHFKEAFTPEFVLRAVRENPVQVNRCIDPFGGSGTTALTCQFLGISPITIEVNPYLADLIESKLTSYDPDSVARDLGRVLRISAKCTEENELSLPGQAPATMIEPGVGGRWIFDSAVAKRIAALSKAITNLHNVEHERLFRVLLGGILLDVSNVVVNGKGRRYRRHWKERPRNPNTVERLFITAVRHAITDIHSFSGRSQLGFTLIRGDARKSLIDLPEYELAVFSPPYPNSFDYTDVYNVELWTLGYLASRESNWELRKATLCSHVQIDRSYPPPPLGSRTLDDTLKRLNKCIDSLWNSRIPQMVGGYFADLIEVLFGVRKALHKEGRIWLVVGDSRYSDVKVPTALIIEELTNKIGFRTVLMEPVRSMRSSPQQGGIRELAETILVLAPEKSA